MTDEKDKPSIIPSFEDQVILHPNNVEQWSDIYLANGSIYVAPKGNAMADAKDIITHLRALDCEGLPTSCKDSRAQAADLIEMQEAALTDMLEVVKAHRVITETQAKRIADLEETARWLSGLLEQKDTRIAELEAALSAWVKLAEDAISDIGIEPHPDERAVLDRAKAALLAKQFAEQTARFNALVQEKRNDE